MDIKLYSFFSGAGFLDLGFEQAGFEIQFVNEYSHTFLNAYKYARKQMGIIEPCRGYYNGDITHFTLGEEREMLNNMVSEDKRSSIVGFIGGPPCPDFSVAGKNEGFTGENGRLTNTYKTLILNNTPDFFVFENVKGLWSTRKHREEYDKLKKSFNRKGYILIDRLVNALEYGVPQDRDRVILFGIHKSATNLEINLLRKHLESEFDWGIVNQASVKEMKNMEWPSQTEFKEDMSMPFPEGIREDITVEYWFKKNNVYIHPNAYDYFKPRQGIEKIQRICEGDVSRKSFKRLHRWRYSPTVAYGNNEVHLHPYKCRRLSVAEALSLQSMPENFVINPMLTLTDKFKIIGNGVPFLMSNAIGTCIRDFLLEFVDENFIRGR